MFVLIGENKFFLKEKFILVLYGDIVYFKLSEEFLFVCKLVELIKIFFEVINFLVFE